VVQEFSYFDKMPACDG